MTKEEILKQYVEGFNIEIDSNLELILLPYEEYTTGQQNPPLKQRACRGNTQAWLISLSSRLATTLPLNRQVLWNATLVPDTTVSY